MNKHLLLLLYILLAGFCLVGLLTCSTEESPVTPLVEPEPDGPKIPLNIPVMTRAVNDGNPENKIVNARLIVIKDNKIRNNKVFTISTSVYTDDSVHVTDYIPVGTIDLFLIANERSEWDLTSLAIGSTCFSNNFEQQILSYASQPIVDAVNPPIPMYKQYRNMDVTLEGQLSIGGTPVSNLGEIERLYAKVTLSIESIFADLANGGDPIQLDSLSVKSMPRYSYIGPSWMYQESSGSAYFDGPRMPRTPAYVADNVHFYDSIVYYIPEHRVYHRQHLTYLSVKASLVDNTDIDQQREFKIAIGDGVTSCTNDSMLNAGYLPVSNLFVTRNTHYYFKAKLRSFDIKGEQEIEIRPQIVAWDEVVLPSDIREYLLQVSQDEFVLPKTSHTGLIVRVETDHPNGWSATVVSPVGTTVLPVSYTGKPSGDLKFNYTGATITGADTIKVTAGNITKHILVKN
jgi:hypothetical protein